MGGIERMKWQQVTGTEKKECFGNISRAIENIKKRIRFEINCYTENNNSIHLEEIKKLNNTLQKLKRKD